MENNNPDVLSILNEINTTMKLVLEEIKKGNEQKMKNTPNLFDIFGGMNKPGNDDEDEDEDEDEDDDDDDDDDEEDDEDDETEETEETKETEETEETPK